MKKKREVVNAFVQFIRATQTQSCELHKLGEIVAWRKAKGLGKLTVFLDAHKDIFDFTLTTKQKGDNVVRLRSACNTSADTACVTKTTSVEPPRCASAAPGENFSGHSTQKNVATRSTPAERREKGDSRVLSCSAAARNVQTEMSKEVCDELLHGFVQLISATQTQVCELQELGEAPVWKETGMGVDKLQRFLRDNRDSFQLGKAGGQVTVRLRPSCTAKFTAASETGAVRSPPAQAPTAKCPEAVVGHSTREHVAIESTPAEQKGNDEPRWEPRWKQRRDVVNAFVRFLRATKTQSCELQEPSQTPAWQNAKGLGVGELTEFLEANKDTFDVNRMSTKKGASIVMFNPACKCIIDPVSRTHTTSVEMSRCVSPKRSSLDAGLCVLILAHSPLWLVQRVASGCGFCPCRGTLSLA